MKTKAAAKTLHLVEDHRNPSSPEERRRFEETRRDFCAQITRATPQASIDTIREALRERYGVAIGTDRISEMLTKAREAMEKANFEQGKEPAMASVPPPTVGNGSVASALVAAKEAGYAIKGIVVNVDGSTKIEV